MTKEIAAKDNKIDQFEVIFPPNVDSSRLLIACSHADYSASHIARAVEDADARLLNLNVTSLAVEGRQVVVALRIDHRNPEAAARSLERYGYEVLSLESAADDDARIRSRYEELMHYLSM